MTTNACDRPRLAPDAVRRAVAGAWQPILTNAAIVAALMLTPEFSAATPLSVTSACSASKARAAANAFRCVTRRTVLAMNTGEPLDLAMCESKMSSGFERAELSGPCSLEGDASTAWAALVSTAETVLDILEADTATTTEEKACVVVRNTVVSRLIRCRVKATRGLLLRGVAHPRVHANECYRNSGEFVTACPGITDMDLIIVGQLTARASAYLRGADLSIAAMSFQALLRGADMTGADLRGSALTGADLSTAILVDSNLQGAGFGFSADLRGADLRNADVAGTYFERTYIAGANLGGVDLTGAIIDQIRSGVVSGCPAVLPANWSCADNLLTGPDVELADGDLDGVDLHGRVLIHAKLKTTFRGADFSAADLTDAVFDSADLSTADLTGADLTDAYFFYSNLSGVNLRQANLQNAVVFGSSFAGVQWDDTTCPDGTNSTANGGSCCAHLVGTAASCSP
jgi:uncharacterized protein YjbI with pentapeptide repeats